jgi:hypothetical protein
MATTTFRTGVVARSADEAFASAKRDVAMGTRGGKRLLVDKGFTFYGVIPEPWSVHGVEDALTDAQDGDPDTRLVTTFRRDFPKADEMIAQYVDPDAPALCVETRQHEYIFLGWARFDPETDSDPYYART